MRPLNRHHRNHCRTGRVTAVLAVALLVAALGAPAAHAGPVDGVVNAGGSDTTLPATDSAVRISGVGSFKNMKFEINQTKEIVNQAISVSWSGGKPTDSVTNIANNYVQIMQCWGDPITAADGTVGPDPRNCQFGGQSQKSWQGNVPGVRVASDYRHYQDPDADGEQVDVPFDAVDGTTVPQMFDGSFSAQTGGAWWLNPYFSYYNTNEIPYAPTFLDGTGNQLFTADTGLEAPGLGCGQAVQPVAGSAEKVPQCWLVIVPRSNYAAERGQREEDLGPGVQGAPFQRRVWANRIAVPLEFKPLATSCALGATERRVVGSELLAPAMSNWTPTLCASANTSPFNYASLSDAQARSQLTGAASGGAGMSAVSRPLDPARVPAGSSAVYAPVALTGLVIGFNIERVLNANLDANGQIPAAEQALKAQRVEHINLTPRLVAKLLTESYQASFIGLPAGASYDWARTNPLTLAQDPEFITDNPEFQLLSAGSDPAMAGLIVELNSSDAAYETWRWILSDPAAADWLAGKPDESGMRVNPYYATDKDINPSGHPLDLPLDNFPKNDPYSVKVAQYPESFPALGMLDLLPYQNSLKSAALAGRTTDTGAKTAYDPTIGGIGYQANGPQYQGSRFVLTLTDSASAARYGLQTAALRNASGNFVAPTVSSLLAGQKTMTKSAVPGVLQPNPTSKAADAYPLTDLVYAVTIPQALDAGARRDFSALIRFVDQAGQAPGVAFGQLPPGYAPLPGTLRAQALAASTVIAAGGSIAPTTSTLPTSTPPTTAPPRTTPAPSAHTTPPTTTPGTRSTPTTATSPAATFQSPTVQSTPAPLTRTPVLTYPSNNSGGGSNGGGPPAANGSGNAGKNAAPTGKQVGPATPTPTKKTSTGKAATSTAPKTDTTGPISSSPTSETRTTTQAPISQAAPQLAALRTPRDTPIAPILPIALGLGLFAAILAPFVSRRRPKN